jgi:hypothetical protein
MISWRPISGSDGEAGMAKILESGSQKAGFIDTSSVWTYAIRISAQGSWTA